MQHPLGVAALADGSVAVADTYNNAVRRFDPATEELSTVASGLAEVSGLVVAGDRLLTVESAAHRLTEVSIGRVTATGFATATQRAPIEVAAEVELSVLFAPPPGQKLDDRFGPSAQLSVTSTPPALLGAGDGTDTSLTRRLTFDAAVGSGVLHINARAASCDVTTDPGGACRMHQQDWGIPVSITTGGSESIELTLGGALDAHSGTAPQPDQAEAPPSPSDGGPAAGGGCPYGGCSYGGCPYGGCPAPGGCP